MEIRVSFYNLIRVGTRQPVIYQKYTNMIASIGELGKNHKSFAQFIDKIKYFLTYKSRQRDNCWSRTGRFSSDGAASLGRVPSVLPNAHQ